MNIELSKVLLSPATKRIVEFCLIQFFPNVFELQPLLLHLTSVGQIFMEVQPGAVLGSGHTAVKKTKTLPWPMLIEGNRQSRTV